MSEHPNSEGRPTDLELMLYADGELEGERIGAVEAFLARDAGSRRKLSALHLVSGLVREQALASATPADGIAEALMAQIAAETGRNGVGPTGPKQGQEALSPEALARLVPVAPGARSPANDNSRSVFLIAAAAIAAAAALMIWSRVGSHSEVASNTPAPQVAEAHPIIVPLPTSVKLVEPLAEVDGEHGVEVAAVDFGARQGSIFYVPTGSPASNATTTVVWLNDEALGEP